MSDSLYQERRKHKRHQLGENSASVLITGRVMSLHVFDISRGGVSFSYAGWQEWEEKAQRMTLLAEELFLENLPVKVVSDRCHVDREHLEDGQPILRRCGIQFDGLTNDQQQEIDGFLDTLLAEGCASPVLRRTWVTS